MTPFPADPAGFEKCVPESVFLLKGSSQSDLGRRSREVRAAVNDTISGSSGWIREVCSRIGVFAERVVKIGHWRARKSMILQWKSMYSLRKSVIFNENQCIPKGNQWFSMNSLGDQWFSMKVNEFLKEINGFQWKSMNSLRNSIVFNAFHLREFV